MSEEAISELKSVPSLTSKFSCIPYFHKMVGCENDLDSFPVFS